MKAPRCRRPAAPTALLLLAALASLAPLLPAAHAGKAPRLTPEMAKEPLDLVLDESEGRDPRGVPPLGIGWKLNSPNAQPAHMEDYSTWGFELLKAFWRADGDGDGGVGAAAATAAADQQQPAPLTGPNTTPYYPVSAKVPYNDAVMEEHRHARSYRKLYAQQHGMLEAVAGTFTSGAVSFYFYSSQLTP